MPRKKKTEDQPCSSRDVDDPPSSRRKRAAASQRKAYEEEEDDIDDPPPPPKKKLSKKENKKKVEKSSEAEKENENVDLNEEKPGLKKKIFTPGSVVQFYEQYQCGKINNKIRHCLKGSIINHIKSFKWYKAESCFDRRVTFIEWHPTDPKVLAVASKSGDIILWNYENPVDASKMIKGSGAGGSIQALKFDPFRPDYIYTVSIEGKFLKVNFHTKQMVQYLQTNDYKNWYCSCDVNFEGKVMVAGDSKGILTFLTTEGEHLWEIKAGKTKISHAEFSKREPWLLCTSTGEIVKTDDGNKTRGVVKLWDIRNMSKEKSNEARPLHVIQENRALNAAYFSLTDGNRLLTTNQGESIKVYKSPLWYEETSIVHPHRQFQHLTQIRAYWHPLEDIIVCGRYPDPKNIINESDKVGKDGQRTIDFFDADTGELLHQHSSPGFNGIYCLNRFNHYGDALASGTGTQIVVWRPDYKDQERSDAKFFNRKKDDDDSGGDDDDNDDKRPPKNLKNTKNLFNKTNLVQREPVKTKKLQLTLKK